jgi:hypothetical protein
MARPLRRLVISDLVKLRVELISRLGYLPSSVKQFEVVSNLVFRETGVLLSVSTLQRFMDETLDIRPSSSTLDALAKFLGFMDFADWVRGHQFGVKFLTYLGKLSHAKQSKTMSLVSSSDVWTSENHSWFQTALLITPIDHWDELFSEAQLRLLSWEDRYLAGLILALSMRSGQVDVSNLSDKIINHPFFMERITTYFIDEERPNWYLALMPRAADCPEKLWLSADKKAIDFSLAHLKDSHLEDRALHQWDNLMQLTGNMSNVPIARLAACFSQVDRGRKNLILELVDSWFGAISHDEQLKASQFLVRQLQRKDWPELKEILNPIVQVFNPRNSQQIIELKHFKSLVNALEDQETEPAIFYHLHNSEMNYFHYKRIKSSSQLG